MLQSLGRHKDFGLLVLRLGLGFTFIYFHGWPKLSGGPDKWTALGAAMVNLGVHSFPVFWGFMSSVVELGGGIVLILGWKLRPVCLLLIFNMVVAVLSNYAKGGGAMGTAYPFEMLIVFIALLFLGAGKYSMDKN